MEKNEGLTNSDSSVKTFERVYKKILVYFTSSAFEVDSIISARHSVWKSYKNVSFETIFALFVGFFKHLKFSAKCVYQNVDIWPQVASLTSNDLIDFVKYH